MLQKRERDIFADSERSEQCARLKQHSESPTNGRDFAFVHGGNFLAKDFYRAGGRLHRADNVTEQRALPATAPAHDHKRLAAMDVERNVVDHRAITEFSDKVDNFDYRGIRRG